MAYVIRSFGIQPLSSSLALCPLLPSCTLLLIHQTTNMLCGFVPQAFAHAVPSLWKTILCLILSANSYLSFRHELKRCLPHPFHTVLIAADLYIFIFIYICIYIFLYLRLYLYLFLSFYTYINIIYIYIFTQAQLHIRPSSPGWL